jgi:predicted enzyme related to lactoylglutathione lyase
VRDSGLQVEQVDFVSVPTRDVARAVAFYRDVLGTARVSEERSRFERDALVLGAGGRGEPFVPNVSRIALRDADVPTAVDEVKSAGAEVIGIEDTGVCHMGFVKDPDGNVLILHRRYAPKVRRGES